MAHAGIRRSRILFLSMLKNVVRIQTYGLYAKHTLGIRWIGESYARGTLLKARSSTLVIRWPFAGMKVYHTASVLIAHE